jgi:uncharacterized protein
MTDGTTSDLSQYRIERANSTLEEAALLAEKGFWAAATNRLYYACFYAASALLLKHGKNFRRHSGLIAVFNTDFVRTGIVPVETGAVLSMLFSHRQRADYDDLPQFDKEQVDNWRRQAHDFVSVLQNLL